MSVAVAKSTNWHDWFKPFARLGYGARGLVYLVLAFFIISAALTTGSGGDARDAVDFITQSTASAILTPLLIVSLAGYCCWRLVQALFDTDDHGIDPKGLAVRAGLLGSAATYGFLMVYTLSLWWGGAVSSGGGSGVGFARTAATFIGAGPMSIILSVIFAVVGAAHVWKALHRKYRDHIEASQAHLRWIDIAAIGGLTARGAIFLVIAFLLLRHGLAGEEGRAGLAEALDFVASLPFGAWLLGAIGAGFFLFSAYSLAEAIWRRINVENA
ncbi:DUF1206 domain-containing protein [Hoeflea sp. YIM 152468]|uniref:DUF1206 domain-containing protein n=1 Tax=Hoeflea sp. YIM 152468 TaxID=3031759 RepID=UPI0023DC82FE|nr:DUF1206 domain-containing protein [Hoeflea sp. YIM 152468]MDF1609741.1 DUF1206 domain-containing protein [Hoeflea sp. YIM 152468]